jgi:predicted ATP-binding protein involved in virulence
VIYHLINLNSVFKNGEISGTIDQNKYRCINIVFDEVELYFHPEFQRTYINDLLTSFKRINPANIDEISGINICMLTHSPFILSDIPVRNTLRIDKGKIVPLPLGNTFGANIHDLLADDFFMENGFMGAVAKKKIGAL